LFAWLLDKLNTDDPGGGWARVDGTLIASLSETLESLEHVAAALEKNPADGEFIRLRNTLNSQVVRLSGLVGLCPADRARQPKTTPEPEPDDAFAEIMRRMGRG
jgi:hypothetical protein